MAKHTYGFPSSVEESRAKEIAVEKCRTDGFLLDENDYEVTIVHSKELDDNNEYHVVIRSDREGHIVPIATEVEPYEVEPKNA